jgi:hypothetical protein
MHEQGVCLQHLGNVFKMQTGILVYSILNMLDCKCPQAVCLQHFGNVLKMHQDTLASSVCGRKLLATSV